MATVTSGTDTFISPHSFFSARGSHESVAFSRRRGLGRLIDKVIVPEEDDRDMIFQAAHQDSRIFFRHLKIRPDGGLEKSPQRNGEALFSLSRCISVFIPFCFILLNIYTVCSNLLAIERTRSSDESFVLLVDPAAKHYFRVMQLAVAGVEAIAMVLMVTYSLSIVIRYNWCLPGTRQLNHYRIWHQLYTVCCIFFPSMTNFSAMKSLQFLNPQVMGTALSLEMTKVEEGASRCRILIVFVASRLLFGTLGFVAFAIKLAHLVSQLLPDPHQKFGLHELGIQIGLLFGFVNQAFGITQISQVETSRLFLFIFGGEDSAMQAGELDRQEAFLAFVVYTVCTKLYTEAGASRFGRKVRRAVALLSFTHLDIQSLVLDEDESQEVDAATLRERADHRVQVELQ